ncbi:MAG: hypothetical protein JNL25_11025 [Rhodospirillaceae bacterium]|nr:hypothetical protein [Rhodospirillaceae bacterium]
MGTEIMGRALLNWLPWHRNPNILADEEGDRVDVGSVLVEHSDKLPEHMFAHWRVEKRFKGPGEVPHVALRNVTDPYAHKLIAVSALVSARRFQLVAGTAAH